MRNAWGRVPFHAEHSGLAEVLAEQTHKLGSAVKKPRGAGASGLNASGLKLTAWARQARCSPRSLRRAALAVGTQASVAQRRHIRSPRSHSSAA